MGDPTRGPPVQHLRLGILRKLDRVALSGGDGAARHSGRYDRVGGHYSQARPRYPDELIGHVAGLIAVVPGAGDAGPVLDIGSGTGAFTRQLRAALPVAARIIGVEPGEAMRLQAAAEAGGAAGIAFVEGSAEAIPCGDGTALAVVAATAAHWFNRPRFYREARRVLVPGGVLAIVEYVRDTEKARWQRRWSRSWPSTARGAPMSRPITGRSWRRSPGSAICAISACPKRCG